MKKLNNNKGFASIEATVLMVLFVSLLYFAFGFFGIVHTAILHNIHSRTYAFETFRHRTNLYYFRSNRVDTPLHFYNTNTRLHGINTDSDSNPQTQIATERPISMGLQVEVQGRKPSTHAEQVMEANPGDRTSVQVNPVWITTMYGICLNSGCGG